MWTGCWTETGENNWGSHKGKTRASWLSQQSCSLFTFQRSHHRKAQPYVKGISPLSAGHINHKPFSHTYPFHLNTVSPLYRAPAGKSQHFFWFSLKLIIFILTLLSWSAAGPNRAEQRRIKAGESWNSQASSRRQAGKFPSIGFVFYLSPIRCERCTIRINTPNILWKCMHSEKYHR